MKIIIALNSLFFLISCSSQGPIKMMDKCPDKPNCVSSFEKGDHFINPIETSNGNETFIKIRFFLKSQENVNIIKDHDHYIHAVFTSSFFRFKDDVEFKKENNLIQVRSASRIGYSDMGVNRKRIEAIRDFLSK